MAINAGKMNISITLQSSSGGVDTYGQPNRTWNDVVTVWAEKNNRGSRKFYQAQKLYAETTDVFTTWYIAKIDTLNRIKFGNRYYNILGYDNTDERNLELVLIAKEEV